MFDTVSQRHRRKAYRDDRGKLEDTGYRPVPILLQRRKQVSRPDSKTGKEKYESDPSENDCIDVDKEGQE